VIIDLPAAESVTQVTSVKTPTFTIVAPFVCLRVAAVVATSDLPSVRHSTDSFCAISTLNRCRRHNVSSTVDITADRSQLPDMQVRTWSAASEYCASLAFWVRWTCTRSYAQYFCSTAALALVMTHVHDNPASEAYISPKQFDSLGQLAWHSLLNWFTHKSLSLKNI